MAKANSIRTGFGPYGFPGTRTVRDPWTETERAEALRLYATGMGIRPLARVMNRSSSSQRDMLSRCGVVRRDGGYRKYQLDETFFATDTERSAYWAGFIAADGSVRPGDVRIAIKADDRAHLEQFATDVGYTGAVREFARPVRSIRGRRVSKPSTLAGICVWSPRMVRDLERFGVVRNKSLILRPWDGPDEYRRHYLRGLIDGDGSWGINSQGYAFCNLVGTKAILDWFLAFVVKHVGHSFRIWPVTNSYIGTIQSSHAVQRLARVLYDNSTVSLPRKRAIVNTILARTWKPANTRKNF